MNPRLLKVVIKVAAEHLSVSKNACTLPISMFLFNGAGVEHFLSECQPFKGELARPTNFLMSEVG